MSQHTYSLLCLGDSYTIGEGVPLYESFPYQTMQLLRHQGLHVHAPEIVAKTGWTTDELAAYLIHYPLQDAYDFVTLLIGVNNQYRGMELDNFQEDADFLLRKAIHLAGNQAHHVAVLSIPDWGVTPFANKKNSETIAAEIDAFNAAIAVLATKYGAAFIDNAKECRVAAFDSSLLAADGLHPSAKLYNTWANKVKDWLLPMMKKH